MMTGAGFQPSENSAGNGLSNMKATACKISAAVVWSKSQPRSRHDDPHEFER